MSSKTWIIATLALPFPILFSVALLNYYIDPLWNFSHTNSFNQHQRHFNTRQQKTNNIFFNGLGPTDTILLGSSRCAIIDQYAFLPELQVFNYASHGMASWEYEEWIEIAESVIGHPAEHLILGIGFMPSGRQRYRESRRTCPDPRSFYETSGAPLYRYKTLFSWDVTEKSFANIYNALTQKQKAYYDRENRHFNTAKTFHYVREDAEQYRRWLEGFSFSPRWRSDLIHLKQSHPDTEFIIFTTPVYFKLTEMLKQHDHCQTYGEWLRTLVDIFGSVHHFMYVNSVTTDRSNFYNLGHYNQDVAQMIVDSLMDRNTSANRFGVLLTAENLQAYLEAECPEYEALQ